MIILIDNGHGSDTPGKRSPDGLFREYKYNRIIARQLSSRLQSLGFETEMIVLEEEDIPLSVRCKRVNDICSRYGKNNCILISIHVNAFGDGSSWTSPRGWSVWTTKGNTAADRLADSLAQTAKRILVSHQMRFDWSDGDADFEQGFYILKHTLCPAVLTENLFMTNKDDVEFLESEEGKEAIVRVHVEGIIEFISKRKKEIL